ncbi:MAG: hypothetical protein FWH48_11585 [Oscillospiraceae bacterium]|nr:hypothetical protein [Oscillospiraceae bacterium]
MNSRERIHLVLNNQKPDRLPFNFWMDRDLMSALDKKLGENFRVAHYGADVIETFPGLPFFSEFAANAEYFDDGKTVWTKKHAISSVTELECAAYFDPNNPDFYACIKNDRTKYPDKALFALMVTPLEILFGNIGMEQLFYDIADYDDIIEYVCEKISRVQMQAVEHIVNSGVDVLYLAGDICSTKGALMSHKDLRRFCFDPIKKVVDRAHEFGVKVFFHTDGHVMDILPLFVEYGLDGINPLQASAKNDVELFAKEYGDKLMVYGGIDNCFIIPDGTEEDIRNHIDHLFKTLGKNGRYIASSHDIPSKAPLRNIDVMVEAIKNCIY